MSGSSCAGVHARVLVRGRSCAVRLKEQLRHRVEHDDEGGLAARVLAAACSPPGPGALLRDGPHDRQAVGPRRCPGCRAGRCRAGTARRSPRRLAAAHRARVGDVQLDVAAGYARADPYRLAGTVCCTVLLGQLDHRLGDEFPAAKARVIADMTQALPEDIRLATFAKMGTKDLGRGTVELRRRIDGARAGGWRRHPARANRPRRRSRATPQGGHEGQASRRGSPRRCRRPLSVLAPARRDRWLCCDP